MDEGVKYLTESLKETQITELDLSENKIGSDVAQYLNKMLSNTKMRSLYLDVHYTEDGDVNKYISQRSYCDIKNIHITIHNNKIGIKGAQYLNKTFQNIAIAELTLDSQNLEADDAQYLAQAFKNTKISELKMFYNHIMQLNGIQYLVQAFKDSQIAKLNVHAEKIRTTGVKYLAEFLREVKVLDLDLGLNYIGDEGMKYLAPALKNSDIMYINLAWNDIEAEGARYLSKILQNSKILFIDLCNNGIGTDGARYLADGLPYSQVTGIHLHGNMIEYAGYKYLIDVVDNTNISWVNLHYNNIEAGLEEGTKLWPYSIPRDTITIAYKICHVFKELVSLNPMSDEFEFIVPRKNTYPTVDIDQYAFLVRTLNDNPNSKVHIFDMMCKKDHGNDYDFNIMNNINEFIAIMPNKFNTFFNSKLPDIVDSFGVITKQYVKLVKQFEEIKMYDVVQNLLLHRVLYYVDENQEILHPYIYKMLNKYNIPLYNEQIEPDIKEKIISYYANHPEVDDTQDIIDLLGQVEIT